MAYFIVRPQYKKKPNGSTMTVILNLNDSDPTTWATYADDAAGMTAGSDAWDDFFGHYPCILDNGVELGKLKKDNFAQYEDGTAAPITTLGKDVMICFPKRGIKIEYLNANTLSVSMTDEEDKDGFSYLAHSYKGNPISNFYLGAYCAYVSSNKLYSSSGRTPTGSQSIGTFRTYAQARGTGYEQSGFFQLIFRQVMYLLKYKGQNAQVAIGNGYTNYRSSSHSTGGTNARGMDWGEAYGYDQMKLFGIEDFYGNLSEYVDGLWSNSSRQLYVSDGNFNDTGSGYISAGTSYSSSNMFGYMRYPNGTNLAGFTNKSASYGSYDTYFCDYINISASVVYSAGANYGSNLAAGVFAMDYLSASSKSEKYGARLMYMKS